MNKIKFIIIILIMFNGCKKEYNYSGPMDPSKHHWLKNKKIFIDPGHGGKGTKDQFRIGPNGITEEEVNLKVGLILNDMLKSAGAIIKLSRQSDIDIDLDSRIEMAKKFKPDLLLSIHHNGSPRREDDVNYPCVIIWGSKEVRPASYGIAVYLQKELNKLIGVDGKIVSDFSVFHETGTRILRRTRYLCPGILGEAGFFSHPIFAEKLKQIEFNAREAEAYFSAVSKYFKTSSPEPEILFSCNMDNSGYLSNMIKDKNPIIALKTESDIKKIHATFDGIMINTKKKSKGLYLFDYGSTIHPGGHRIKFQIINSFDQSSMIYTIPFTVEIKKGDFHKLRIKGSELINSKKDIKEGLKMLLAALSMGLTDPEDDELIYEISNAFKLIGDVANSEYYLKKLFYFYPDSKLRNKIKDKVYYHNSHRYPVEYHGKKANIKDNYTF